MRPAILLALCLIAAQAQFLKVRVPFGYNRLYH
jgi:hypothetical protein